MLPITCPVLLFGSMRANATAHATPEMIRTIVREWYQQKCANRERPRGRGAVSTTPVQTVRADFPHTAYQGALEVRHYAASGYRIVPRRRCRPRARKKSGVHRSA